MGYQAVTPGRLLAMACLLLGATLANFGQQTQATDKDRKEQKKEQKKEPAPLFGGKMGIKSSSQTKETASLGFNGIDPSGKVDAKMMATTPSAEHQAKAKQLSAMVPNTTDLAAFLKDGGLKSK